MPFVTLKNFSQDVMLPIGFASLPVLQATKKGKLLRFFLKSTRKLNTSFGPELGYPLSEHAILYRSHFQSRSIEEALIRHAIPYKIMGGIQFYDRLEIKDMLAYMRLIINPFDRLAFSRVINTPSRGLGDKFEELFYATWDMMPFSRFDEIARTLIEQSNSPRAKQMH